MSVIVAFDTYLDMSVIVAFDTYLDMSVIVAFDTYLDMSVKTNTRNDRYGKSDTKKKLTGIIS